MAGYLLAAGAPRCQHRRRRTDRKKGTVISAHNSPPVRTPFRRLSGVAVGPSPGPSGIRVALIASVRYPIREPFAGGLEAHTWALARGLRQRGHDVTVFAGAGCDPGLGVREIVADRPHISPIARADISMTAEGWLEDHHAYLQLMVDLTGRLGGDFDVVHNNCLHYLPVATARLLPVPMVATLHTPPTPWLESAIQAGTCPVTFAAVSTHTARAWAHQIPAVRVIHNGVDCRRWYPGPGGDHPVWFGRLVPEKGPDLAILAARRAGVPLNVVGPISDPRYFRTEIEPLLGDGVQYLGHLDHATLAQLVGRSSVCMVTPRWDEPYGLVAAEALACGTPVCGFARGALPEILGDDVAVLVEPDDVESLADGLGRAQGLSRTAARAYALAHCSEDAMIGSYQSLYAEVVR
jgi:glycosyltransferase involved in cell wall biosynthesis